MERLLGPDQNGWYHYQQMLDPAIVGFPPRADESLPASPVAHLAAAGQKALQAAVARVAESAMTDSKCRDLCLGGGVALNCSNNGALASSAAVRRLWVFAAPGDSGLPVGAALLCAAEAGALRRAHVRTAAWGPRFDASETTLRADPRLVVERPDDPSGFVAAHLAEGRVVGWFQGRMELGPRALGQRSILADPRTVAMRDWVNRLKRREPWRPLAPVVRAGTANDYFDGPADLPFMLHAVKVRPDKRDVIPAVVHVDGTARAQTVCADEHQPLWDVLCEFARLTGVGALINTSFNRAGEPIVCSPDDAVRTLLESELDLLVLDDLMIRRASEASLELATDN